MSVYLEVEQELRKALDDGKLGIHKRSESRQIPMTGFMSVCDSVLVTDIIDVYHGDDKIIDVKEVEKILIGGDKYHTYSCSDLSFTPEECKRLYTFLNEYERSFKVLGKLKDINGKG